MCCEGLEGMEPEGWSRMGIRHVGMYAAVGQGKLAAH